MEKFTQNVNEKVNPFANNDTLKTKVFNMINEDLKLTIDGSKEMIGGAYIDGMKELTDMIVKLVRTEKIKEEIKTLETIIK